MADYNIYIHNVNGQSATDSPSKAWSRNKETSTKAWNSNSNQVDTANETNMTTIVAALKGVKSAAKAIPVIAAAITVTTIAIKVTDIITPFVSRETGDYRWSVMWSNAKNAVNSILHPFSTVHGFVQNYQETMLFNKAQEQQRLLIGESYTNSKLRRF